MKRTEASRNRHGKRWTFFGLPGGATTARPASMGPPPSRRAIPLVTFRAGGLYDAQSAVRVRLVRDWVHRTHELVPMSAPERAD